MKTILIKGLDPDVTEERIRSRLAYFGQVEKCHVVHEGNVGGTTAVVEMNISDTAMNYLLLRISHIWYETVGVSARLLHH